MKHARASVVLGVVALVISLVATLLAGCGSGEKLYTDSTYGYSFSYPSSWKVKTQAGESDVTAGGTVAGNVGAYNPEGTKVGDLFVDLAMVMVYNLNFTVSDPWDANVQGQLAEVLQSLESQFDDLKVEKALSQTTTAGLKGYTITYTFSKEGTPMRSTLYFLFNGSREYELTQQAAISAWDATLPALDSIVSSFKPGKAK